VTIDGEDLQFIEQKLPDIEGWLCPEAAQLTVALLRSQDGRGVEGAVLEIGVWRGKYLALLYHASTQRVVGIDIFEWGNSQEEVVGKFQKTFGDISRLTLIRADSRRLSSSQAPEIVGTPHLRFMSIDGAHTADAVCHDMTLANAWLGELGIIALDDFLNSRAIGVSEGAYRYFFEHNHGRLTPFAYCGNKLFIARPKAADLYSETTLQFLSGNAWLPVSRTFAEFAKKGDSWVKQELLGRECLILT
jgi:hypothetical protein